MAEKTKTINAGHVGLKPKGDYTSTGVYTLLDTVRYNHDSWVCKAKNADGSAAVITGHAPSEGSQYWQALTDGGLAAYNEGETARQKGLTAEQKGNTAESQGNTAQQKADLASEKATLADTKAQYATQQGDYAKTQAERAEAVAEQVVQEVLDALVFASDATCESIIEELT